MSSKKNKWNSSFKLLKPILTPVYGTIEEYQPKTLHSYNQYRRQFLATFPNVINQSTDRTSLLLANVPAQALSTIELTRRSPNAFHNPFNPVVIQHVPSYIHRLFENLYGDLKNRLRIDTSILDYNLYRLNHIVDIFINKYRSCEQSNILFDHQFPIQVSDQSLRILHHNESTILLEFFLQIDVDTFYMKTCSYRMQNQLPLMKSLFCTDDNIKCNYDFKPCRHFYCKLCQTNETQEIVEFSTCGHQHRFINGYETILNCPADCQTRNIVYALTCVCGQYDYIGSTKYTLMDVLEYHRQHISRIMIEYLINGAPFPIACTCTIDRFNNQRANRMRLYQHFTHCSKALKLFLAHNPEYWCFVPQKIDDTKFDDLSYSTFSKKEEDVAEISPLTSKPWISVSQPPSGFTFSKRQIDEQCQFLQNFTCHELPSCSTFDCYRATIIAVLPDQCSAMLRQMIEILFVTHAETKLNSMNLSVDDNKLLYGLPYKTDQSWCANLSKSYETDSYHIEPILSIP